VPQQPATLLGAMLRLRGLGTWDQRLLIGLVVWVTVLNKNFSNWRHGERMRWADGNVMLKPFSKNVSRM